MHVIRPEEAPVTTTPNATMAGGAAPSRGSKELSTWTARMSAGASGPEHTVDREQVWTVLSGSLVIEMDGASTTVPAGATAVLPADRLHRVHAPYDAEAAVAVRADALVTTGGAPARPIPWAE